MLCLILSGMAFASNMRGPKKIGSARSTELGELQSLSPQYESKKCSCGITTYMIDNNRDEGTLLDWGIQNSFYVWKKVLTRGDGDRCRFSPSCSAYMEEMIQEKGFLVGAIAGVDRILRDHPYHDGEYAIIEIAPGLFRLHDPIPPKTVKRHRLPKKKFQ